MVQHLAHQGAQVFATLGHHLGKQQRHEQAVALHHMARQPDAARFLAAQHDAAALHLAVDPLEAHRRGHQLEAKLAAHAVEQR